jgi:hypothetical protein
MELLLLTRTAIFKGTEQIQILLQSLSKWTPGTIIKFQAVNIYNNNLLSSHLHNGKRMHTDCTDEGLHAAEELEVSHIDP